MIIITEDNLTLELINESFSSSLITLINSNRNYLSEWLPWVDKTRSVDQIREFIKASQKKFAENNGFDCCIKNHNAIIGVIGLHKIDHINKITSIGYWLGSEYQGQGFMTKACKNLTEYCFKELNINRIEIKCATENFKSQAIPQRLNFKNEGILRQAEFLNGRYVDHFLFSKLKSDMK